MHDGITSFFLSQSHWRRFGVFAVLRLGCSVVVVHNWSLLTVSSRAECKTESLSSKGWMQSPSTSAQYDKVAIQLRIKVRLQDVKPYNIGVGKLSDFRNAVKAFIDIPFALYVWILLWWNNNPQLTMENFAFYGRSNYYYWQNFEDPCVQDHLQHVLNCWWRTFRASTRFAWVSHSYRRRSFRFRFKVQKKCRSTAWIDRGVMSFK